MSILFSLALVFQGATHARAAQPPCPMEQSGEVAHVDETAGNSQGDCCNDADTVAKTGKLCKTGAECQAASAGLVVAYAYSFVVADSATPPRFVERLDLIRIPSSVWRPPALT